METQTYANPETIDLREVFHTIRKRKTLIYVITSIITLVAILYAFLWAKPVYEVKAMIEIGKINAGTRDETPLDNIEDVKQKLEYLYGVKSKKKRAYPRLKSISIPKNSKGIFGLTVEGNSNQSSSKQIDEIIKKIEATYVKKTQTYTDAQKALIALTQKDIETTQKNLKNIQNTLIDYNKQILNITQEDAALAGLYTIQISQNQERLQKLESRISDLKAKVFDLELSITPLRMTQTHKIGPIEVLDKPIKPKKALIVIVAFITGLMFSIFLVFFLSFLENFREKP